MNTPILKIQPSSFNQNYQSHPLKQRISFKGLKEDAFQSSSSSNEIISEEKLKQIKFSLTQAGYKQEILPEQLTNSQAKVIDCVLLKTDDFKNPIKYPDDGFKELIESIENENQADCVIKLINDTYANLFLNVVSMSKKMANKEYLKFAQTCFNNPSRHSSTASNVMDYFYLLKDENDAKRATQFMKNSVCDVNDDNFKFLLETSKTNPKKASYITQSENLIKIFDYIASFLEFNSLESSGYREIASYDVEELSNLDSFCEDLKNKKENTHKSGIICLYRLASKDKKAYEYIMNSPDLLNKFINFRHAECCVPALTVETLKEIEKGFEYIQDKEFKNLAKSFVENSDSFNKNKNSLERLNTLLENCENENDITLYRGERGTSNFETIDMTNTFLAKEAKILVLLHAFEAKKTKIYSFSKVYSDFSQGTSLYDTIMKKEKITLSDIMQTARFGNQKYVNKIIEEIKKAQFTDNRLKSTTLDSNFANMWARNNKQLDANSNTTCIVGEVKLKKGNKGAFIALDSGQIEYLTAGNKLISYTDGYYDKEKNSFILKEEYSPIS